MKQNIGRLTTARQNNVGQLELVKQEKFAGLEVSFYQDGNGDVYMTRNQIGEALGYTDPVRAVSKLHDRNRFFENEEFSFQRKLKSTDNKYYNTYLLTQKGIVSTLIHSHRPLELKNKVARTLGIQQSIQTHFKSRDEDEFIHLIQTTFKQFNSEREAVIGGYRCDLLFRDFNLIVECDEFGHVGYDVKKEEEREAYLTEQGYNIYRFNPDAHDFYIGDVLAELITLLHLQ